MALTKYGITPNYTEGGVSNRPFSESVYPLVPASYDQYYIMVVVYFIPLHYQLIEQRDFGGHLRMDSLCRGKRNENHLNWGSHLPNHTYACMQLSCSIDKGC